MTAPASRTVPTAGLLIAAAAAFALLLALPGQTITTAYVNDLFIFLDGAYRIAAGQVPNRDFHTALGPLVFYLPALGLWVSGTLGGAMPTGMALLLGFLAPVVAHVLASRLRPAVALPFGVFLLLVLAVPMNLGESIRALSFAMFYNRIGWAALALLLVMYCPPLRPSRRQAWLDALSAAALTVLMLTLKVTYGVVALAFLAFMLLDRHQRRWAGGAIGLTLLAGLLIELVWGASFAHFYDLLLTSQVSGARGFVDWTLGFLRHLADYVMFGIIAGLALWRSRSWRDALFYGFCAGVGLVIMAQNSQPWGIITVHAGAAVGAELLLRSEEFRTRAWTFARGVPLVLLALVLPTAVHCLLALGLHAGLAAARFGEPFPMAGYGQVRLALLWEPGDHDFSSAYLASLKDGAALLATVDNPKHVSVLDFANPFSAGLGLDPPRGDNAWLHWGRNVSLEHHLPGGDLLGGVHLLMVPKWGINNIPLADLYADTIRTQFEPARESAAWTLYRRRESADRPVAEPASGGQS
ncbi:MAG TPA: hypothetical protein VGU24_19810 [Microvirga sp.]|jgi:hypothetical protein|nr:hypothetical protein [Microvirga sp.]